MRVWLAGLLGVAVVVGGSLDAQDHQRIAAALPEGQAVSLEAGWALADVAGQLADAGGRVDVTYWFREILAVGISVPMQATAGAETVGAFSGTLKVVAKLADWRTRLGLGWLVPGGVLASAGVSWIQDPMVLAVDSTWRVVRGTADWGLSLSATEVLNESVSWSLSLMPSGQLVEGQALWSLALQIQVAWYRGDWNVSSSTTSSSLMLVTEAAVGWRHGW